MCLAVVSYRLPDDFGLVPSETRLWARSIAESALLSSRVDVEGEEGSTVTFERNQMDYAIAVVGNGNGNAATIVMTSEQGQCRMAPRTRGDFMNNGNVVNVATLEGEVHVKMEYNSGNNNGKMGMGRQSTPSPSFGGSWCW